MTIRQPEEHDEPWLHEPRRFETQLEVRLLVHTHWDREWYLPFSQFRARLVALVDEVLDGAAGSPFLLDGQAVVLEDYLEVRPERSADVSTALRQGAIEAGPWYVLADSLIPSGEGLVRNLLAGRRVLRSLRSVAPDVLYCPDSFGHPARLPTIAAQFLCPVVVLWRGYGGASHPEGDTAFWKAPDEYGVFLYHLPPDGYEYGSHLPAEREAARERWGATRKVLAPRATTGMTLLPVGADHHAPAVNVLEAIAALQSVALPDQVQRVSLGQFGRELFQRVRQHQLPQVQGELRDSYGYTWTLQGTLSSRAALKRRYALIESMLLRDVEPWTALARLLGDQVDRRAMLRTAWKPVLLCQPHDTLCGCSVDAVATAMSARLGEAESAAAEIRDAAIMSLAGHDGNAARRQPADWTSVVVVRNAAARIRDGVAEIDVDVVLDDAPVGPASAGIEPRARKTGPISLGSPPVPIQEIARERVFAREEASRHYPWNRLVERCRSLAWVAGVPGYGLVTLPVEEKRRRAVDPPTSVSGKGRTIEGNGVRVEAHSAHVSLTTTSGSNIQDWLSFEVEGEKGDLYTRSAIPDRRALATLVRSRVTARGPLRAELTCDWRIAVPERRLTSAAGEPRRAPATRLEVRTNLQLDAGAPFVRVRVHGENTATDVRLRVGFQTGLRSPKVVADAAFGPVEREPISGHAGRLTEAVPPTAPLHRYVSAYTESSGASVMSDGLAEYEVDGGVVWVTLVRGVGELSRHNLPERPGHAGYPVPTPAAQSLGPFEASFGFLVHGPSSDETTAHIERVVEDVLHPLRGTAWRTAITPPASVIGVELSGDGLACTTIKESEDGEWIVLRCTNLLARQVVGSWQLPVVREAMMARLDETPVEGIPVQDGRVEFVAPPRGVVTVLVR
jgi:mannosylglycerate hydrolase